MKTQKFVVTTLGFMGVFAVASTSMAATVNVDGVNYTTLSAAVAAAYAEPAPYIVNIQVNDLPAEDSTQIILDKPIEINGDAEGGTGDGTPCDLLVDQAGLALGADLGQTLRSYIEVRTAGSVKINNLRLRPNADGTFQNTADQVVSGIRLFNPAAGVGNYELKKVYLSGASPSGEFVSPETGLDLFNTLNMRRWNGFSGTNEANMSAHAGLHVVSSGSGGTMTVLLDHCQVAMCRALALNITGAGATVQVKGGVFGHCGRDAVRINGGANVTMQGTIDDRIRVVRATNLPGNNAHSIEVLGAAVVPLIEYVDIAGCNTANAFSLRGGALITEIRYCRGLGKFDTPSDNITNQAVFINEANTSIGLIRDCTFVGKGRAFNSNQDPLSITNSFNTTVQFTDCIFTSEATGTLNIAATGDRARFTNCAIPTDMVTSETLASTPFSGAGTPTAIQTLSVSPQYRLTMPDYDWSSTQGASNPLNGPGNRNVLRPSNTLYGGASSTGQPLNGGAGAPNAGVDAAVWMLM